MKLHDKASLKRESMKDYNQNHIADPAILANVFPDVPCCVCGFQGTYDDMWTLILFDQAYTLCEEESCYSLVLLTPLIYDCAPPSKVMLEDYRQQTGI